MVTDTSSAGDDVNFPGKHPEEKFQFYYRQHWIRLAWPTLRTAGLTIILIVIGIFLFGDHPIVEPVTRRITFVFILVPTLLVQFDMLSRFYRYFLYVMIVTDRKVHKMKKTLLAFDDHESIDLWVLQDIRKSQRGPIQNLLGFGSIVLDAQNTEMKIHFTPHIALVHRQMMHLREQARRREATQVTQQGAQQTLLPQPPA